MHRCGSQRVVSEVFLQPQIISAMLADQGEKAVVDAYIAGRAKRGLRAIGVAESPGFGGGAWRLVGLISLLDPPRPDSAATIKRAQELGVEVGFQVSRDTWRHQHAKLWPLADSCCSFQGVRTGRACRCPPQHTNPSRSRCHAESAGAAGE